MEKYISENKEFSQVEAVLSKWFDLQKIIKEEITLNEIISKQQTTNIDALKTYYNEFYKLKLKIREISENYTKIDYGNFVNFELNSEPEKVLLEAYDPICKLLFLFRNDFKYIFRLGQIIEESETKENYDTLIDLLVHQFYENAIIQDAEHEELLILVYALLDREIESMNSASVASFLDEAHSFVGKLLKSYTKRPDLKTYLQMTLGVLIVNIENNADSCLDLDLGRISSYIKDKKSSNSVVVNKSYNAEKSKAILINIDNDYLTKKIRKSRVSKSNTDIKSVDITTIASNSKDDKISVSTSNTKWQNVNNTEFFLELVDTVDDYKYEDDEDFNRNYLIEVTQEELNNRYMNEEDENIRDFYLRQLERINKDPNIFTNKKFLISLKELKDSQEILIKYKDNFEMIKDYIDSIIVSLLENISVIPYTLRCICKIINILILRKFPQINKYERNSFIGEFIFTKCIIPILINPDINAIITSTILSYNTKRCLKVIAKVLTKVNRGLFFEANLDTDYTIFNHYIIEIIPEINKFYDNLIDVALPQALEDLLNKNTFIRDYVNYGYFKPNKEELVNVQSILFSVQDVLLIVKHCKNKTHLFIKDRDSTKNNKLFEKTIEKISNQENYLNQLIKLSPQRNFFLIFNVDFNPKKMKLLYPQVFRFTFTNEIESTDVVLKRIKFCIKLILRELNLINHKVYSHLTQSTSTEKFFNALNQILQLEEFNESEFNEKIPLNWYSLYMTSNLYLISEEYKNNDYDKLYDEVCREEKEEIGFLNSKSNLIIAKYGMNIRCIEKVNEKLKRDLFKVKQIEKIMKLDKFIKNAQINVCVRLNSKEDADGSFQRGSGGGFLDNIFFWNKRRTITEKERDLEHENSDYCAISVLKTDQCIHKRLQYIEKLTEGKPEKKSTKGKYKNENKIDTHASTIPEFIKLCGKFKEIKDDIAKGDNRNKIYQSLYNYSQCVREVLSQDDNYKKLDEEHCEEILEGIENYIYKKLYRYVYPRESLEIDIEFYQRTIQLSWITPVELEINKAYLNEKLWDLAITCVNKMDEEKSPYEKLKCVSSAHKIINNCIKFCSGKDEHAGADDLSPIFQFIIIKAKPKRIFSNINFIKCLVHPKKLQGFMGLLLCQIESAAEFILNELDFSKLKISEEKFKEKMKNN